jgi:hypothetical protein
MSSAAAHPVNEAMVSGSSGTLRVGGTGRGTPGT